MARTFGVFWLVCALIGAIVSVALPFLAGRMPADSDDLVALMIGLLVVNLAQWVLAGWLYVRSYRALCRSQAHFALKSLYPTLLSNSPVLVLAVACSIKAVLMVLFEEPLYLFWRLWRYVMIPVVCVAAVGTMVCTVRAVVCTVRAWSLRQPHSHLRALAYAGCALSVMGLVSVLDIVIFGGGDALGEELAYVFLPVYLSFPGFWMSFAYLRCLKTESAARNTS